MRQQITEKITLPEGISCQYSDGILKCTKDSATLERKISIPATEIKIENNEIIIECKKGNKNHYKTINSVVSHIKNIFHGLQKKFVYELESCNVHFPMTIKVDGDYVVINNFLGEKVPRKAKILPGTEVKISGNKITVTSDNREAAGQTAANLEKATKLKGRDRRIFQDGIYIVEKPHRAREVHENAE